MRQGQIILSIGGGGFTHGTDPDLDDFCLQFLPPRPAIGYLGWANKDDETRLLRFYARFEHQVGSLSHLPLGASPAQVRAWVQGKDLIYLGGGNTSDLIAAIQAAEALPILQSVNEAGCVLAGVSAGGACWFDWILSDSGGRGYEPIAGLSLAKGGICPHFSSEPDRKSMLENSLLERGGGTATAVDDSACLVTVNGIARSYFSARSDRAAHSLDGQAGFVTYNRLPEFSADCL
jgi:dipeptidase E